MGGGVAPGPAAPGKIAGSVAAPMPTKWKPQLATPAEIAPKGKGWVHEIKYDGYRMLCRRARSYTSGSFARLTSRTPRCTR